ncbi:urease accessory protein UreF [Blastococcus sp. LR1]|uniref:urease accessory protein UreF n=1 Tax=Blastococcus sp. LR1 TaxID=2877000 RepID=UPI001CCDC42E|nr:urease accessory UreF family protein [Blastococcus sp. LR1]MCA0145231.1 urease accessory protein [Blastococcus sp. LR1]
MSAALLTLADSRLPAGGHTHSGGVEQGIEAGLVHDPRSLATFLHRRLVTAGAVAAGLAAAACGAAGDRGALDALDAEADARTPSPALRAASRQQGRGLVRVGRRAWPTLDWDALPPTPHHAVALGVAAAVAGLTARDAASAAAYLSVSGPATAAQRLLAMDPLTVAAVTARLSSEIDAVAGTSAAPQGHGGHVGPLPAAADPLLDLLAEVHAVRNDRFFAS